MDESWGVAKDFLGGGSYLDFLNSPRIFLTLLDNIQVRIYQIMGFISVSVSSLLIYYLGNPALPRLLKVTPPFTRTWTILPGNKTFGFKVDSFNNQNLRQKGEWKVCLF